MDSIYYKNKKIKSPEKVKEFMATLGLKCYWENDYDMDFRLVQLDAKDLIWNEDDVIIYIKYPNKYNNIIAQLKEHYMAVGIKKARTEMGNTIRDLLKYANN